MAGKRTYGDSCGVARGLDVVGDRWALLVVRELLLGPKRFTDLRGALPHVASDVLAQRLRDLEGEGILRRETLPPPAGSRVYALTGRGRALEPVLLALGRWGSVVPLPPEPGPLSPDAAAVALKTLFAPGAAPGPDASYALRLGEQAFRVAVHGEAIEVDRAPVPGADAEIRTDPGTLARLLWHGGSAPEARRAGTLATAGDARALRRFWRLFPLPDAPAPASG